MSNKIISKRFNYLMLSIFMVMMTVLSCIPERINENSSDVVSPTPAFTYKVSDTDPNTIIISTDASSGFQHIWDLPGGTPKTSTKALDTIVFSKKGDYIITLFVTYKDGKGTGSTSQTVSFAQDGKLACNTKLGLLTGECEAGGKCWTMSASAAAVRVGPSYDDYSWFTSTANSLQAAQYDDRFCFTFENLVYQNRNSGTSVNPWDGYQVQAINPGVSSFIFSVGTGRNNRDQIIIPDDQFMGVWDADNVMDIQKLTKDELVIRARLRGRDGVPAAEGWFELTFKAL